MIWTNKARSHARSAWAWVKKNWWAPLAMIALVVLVVIGWFIDLADRGKAMVHGKRSDELDDDAREHLDKRDRHVEKNQRLRLVQQAQEQDLKDAKQQAQQIQSETEDLNDAQVAKRWAQIERNRARLRNKRDKNK